MNRPPNEELDRLDGAGDLEELIHRGFRGGVRSRLGKFHFCFYLLKCDWNGLPRVPSLARELPHLRIVDQALFDQVAARIAAVGGANAAHMPKSKRALSGLLKCGCCGGGMSIIASSAQTGAAHAYNAASSKSPAPARTGLDIMSIRSNGW
jgi:hypothetical protein